MEALAELCALVDAAVDAVVDAAVDAVVDIGLHSERPTRVAVGRIDSRPTPTPTSIMPEKCGLCSA